MLGTGRKSDRAIQSLTASIGSGTTLRDALVPPGVSLRQRLLSLLEWSTFRDACVAAGVLPTLANYAKWRESGLG